MKKLFIAMFSVVISTTVLTGCRNNNDENILTDIVQETELTAEEYVTQLFYDLSNNEYSKLHLTDHELENFRNLPISDPVESSLRNLEYTIIDSTYTDNHAEVIVEITATNLGLSFEEALQEFFLASNDMGVFTNETKKSTIFQILFLEAYNNNQGDTVNNTVTVYLEKDLDASFHGLDITWDLAARNGYFADAVLGGLFTSMSALLDRPFDPENRVHLDDLLHFEDMFDSIDFNVPFFDYAQHGFYTLEDTIEDIADDIEQVIIDIVTP